MVEEGEDYTPDFLAIEWRQLQLPEAEAIDNPPHTMEHQQKFLCINEKTKQGCWLPTSMQFKSRLT